MTGTNPPAKIGKTLVFDTSDRPKRIHACKVCGKSFKRSEHCIRHQRAHTQEKPYSCKFCFRNYSRRDLVVRHERTLHAGEQLRNAQAGLDVGNGLPAFNDPKTVDNVGAEGGTQHTSARPRRIHYVARPSSQHETDMDSSLGENIAPEGPSSIAPATADLTSPATAEDQSSLESALQPGNGLPAGSALEFPFLAQPSFSQSEFEIMMSSSDLSGLPADGIHDLDFFSPVPGLSLDQLPPSTFPTAVAGFQGFSPLDQSSTTSHSPKHTSSLPTQNVSADFRSPNRVVYRPHTPYQPPSKPTELNDSISQRLPQVIKVVTAKAPALVFTDNHRSILLKDLVMRLPFEPNQNLMIPNSTSLQKCIRTFVDSVLVHLPFLHLHTFDLEHTPSPLVLAMCALGALFRLERKVAAFLYSEAEAALTDELSGTKAEIDHLSSLEDWVRPRQDSTFPKPRPLWIAQCKLLLTFFGAFSGNPAVIRKSLEGMSFLTNDYRSRINEVRSAVENKERKATNWHQWVYRESTKRLLYAIFVLSNLLTTTYGLPPALSIVQDGRIEMPCDENLWDAPTDEKWQQRSSTHAHSASLTYSDAIARLMYGKEVEGVAESSWNWSPFAAVVLMHGVSVQLWHIMQCTQSFSMFAVDQSVHSTLKALVVAQTEAALARCHAHITHARSDQEHTWNEAEGPLLFNCLALLRISYVHVFTGIGAADRMILLCEDASEVASSIREYLAAPQMRSQFTTKAVARAFEGFLVPMRAGALLIQKTAALTWSIEHAIAGWDCGLFVTKWLHAIEKLQREGVQLDDSELANVESMYNFLKESGLEIDRRKSLAAELSRHWASFYDDTWVWGLTPRMGFILRQLADAYAAD